MASPGNVVLVGANADEKYDLCSILCSPKRDYLIRNNGDQVKVDSLRGKVVGLYFSASWCGPCLKFTPHLVEAYTEIVRENEFEIVFASADKDNKSFGKYFSKMPWLAIPFSDAETCIRLEKLFGVDGYPYFVILNEDENVSTSEGRKLIQEYGVEAYPFTSEKIKELKDRDEEDRRSQSLKSLLVSGSKDYVITSDGKKVPVSDLVGKYILLYFAADWCDSCRDFLPKLIKAYQEIKANSNALEVIFLSKDEDHKSFDDYFAKMPWLAVPFGDEREKSLSHYFKAEGIPTVVAIGPDGKTVSTEANGLILGYGPEAYPFTDKRLKEMAKGWAEKVKHASHDHELVLTEKEVFNCDGCGEKGRIWSYYCGECDFDLHPMCAFEDGEEKGGNVDGEEAEDEEKIPAGEWIVCDLDKCYKQ